MQDSLGDRMKRHEAASKILLPLRTYTVVRIDGCHFHTYTKHLRKPFDSALVEAMQEATKRTAVKLYRAVSSHMFNQMKLPSS